MFWYVVLAKNGLFVFVFVCLGYVPRFISAFLYSVTCMAICLLADILYTCRTKMQKLKK